MSKPEVNLDTCNACGCHRFQEYADGTPYDATRWLGLCSRCLNIFLSDDGDTLHHKMLHELISESK